MRQIKHSQLLIDSLIHPKKLAAYRIVSIGKVIQYTFLLVFILTTFSFGQFVNNGANIVLSEEIKDFAQDLQFLVYIIGVVFLFAMNTALVFGKISIYAYVALLLSNAMKRRAEYRQLWRTTAFAVTWETLLSIIFTILVIPDTISLIIFTFITMSILIIALTKYPKLPSK